MENYSETAMRFFNACALVARAYDMQAERVYWQQAAEVCKNIGVPVTRGAAVQIGRWATQNCIAKRKSNGTSLLLMPPLRSL